jgi:hypothetical protein
MTRTRNQSGLPIDLVDAFWDGVVTLLRSEHGLTNVQALRSVLRYRNELDAHEVGDILYHASPKEIAGNVITGGYAGTQRR